MTAPISYPLAKLLKQKRITIGGFKYYDHGGVLNHSIGFIDSNSGLVLAPTIGELVNWIYKNRKIWISVSSIPVEKTFMFEYAISNPSKHLMIRGIFRTPEVAYEQAFKDYFDENIAPEN